MRTFNKVASVVILMIMLLLISFVAKITSVDNRDKGEVQLSFSRH